MATTRFASRMLALGLLPSLLAGLAATSQAASLYRCQDGLGGTTYSQWPCSGQMPTQAQALAISDDRRTAEQIQDGQDKQSRQSRLAHDLQRDRQRWERAHPIRPPGTLSPILKPKTQETSLKRASRRRTRGTDERPQAERLRRPRHFTALIPKSAQTD